MAFVRLLVIVLLLSGALGLIVAAWGPERSAATANYPLPGDRLRLTELVFGCEKEQRSALDRFVVAGDRAAFGAYLDQQIRMGRCTELKPGDTVYVEKVELIAGQSLVRKIGTMRSWWVTSRTLAEVSTKETGRTH